MINECVVRAFPRLHVTLIDLGWATRRKYGGAGFSISGPPLEVAASARNMGISIEGIDHLDAPAQRDVDKVLDRLRPYAPTAGVTLSVSEVPYQHVGLGTKTSLLLAITRAACMALRLPLNRVEIQKITGRGGTSGIGLHSFFEGGFIVDGGQPNNLPSNNHSPSSAGAPCELPPMVCHARIPEEWRFTLLLPEAIRFSGTLETSLFAAATPIAKQECLEVLAAVYHALVPAVITGNLQVLREALEEIHRTGFKFAELEAQPYCVSQTLRELWKESRIAAGMSSMGPLIYVISSERSEYIESRVETIADRNGCTILGTYSGRNFGHEEECDDQG